MSDKKYCNDKLKGVDCDVVNCKYHSTDNCCHADSIMVQAPGAIRKSETFCGTFTPKSSN